MSPESSKRKLTAILSADVKGYSRLMREDEEATVRTLTECKALMSHLIESYRGRVVDSPGDNLLAEFASVVDALRSGVEIQRQLKAKNEALSENRRMEFRIGINLGDVIEEGGRIYGDGVNIAARMEGLAEAGGICVSGTVYEHVKDKVLMGYAYLGEQDVKNIPEPVRVYRVLMEPEQAGKVIGEKGPKRTQWRWAAAAAAIILVAGALALWNFYFRLTPIEPASKEKMAFPLPDKPSIAVLPFVNMSEDPKQEYFSDGLTEEIITALSKMPKLFVIARNSTFSYKGKSPKVRQVAEELGVRYVLEGSVRKSGEQVRITAQLIDALSGHHLWAERYDRHLKDIFALQDTVTMKILTALQVKLTDGEYARVSAKGTDNLQAYLKVLQAREPFYTMTKEGFAEARRLCEEAIALDPKYAAAYVYLGSTHFMDVRLGTSKSPQESIKLAFEFITKAKALDDSYSMAGSLLGFLYVMKRDYDKGIAECERAIDLEPNSGAAHMWMSLVFTFAENHEEAVRHGEQALRLDPFPVGWWFRALGLAYFGAGRYEEAIAAHKRALQSAPDDILTHLPLTTAYSWAGRLEEARNQAAEVLRISPKFTLEELAKRSLYRTQAGKERYFQGLRKAGLPEKSPLPLPDKPSIAVLPFVNMSDDKSQEYFSDGLTEEIITALSKVSQLFVIARNSSFVYKGKPVNVQQVSRELGVKYLLEGSVRTSGDQLRITAQLIDATIGNHLWAERYDREMKDVFAIQDEITIKIVGSCIHLTHGQMAGFLRGRHPSNLQAYLKLLEGIAYNYGAKFSDAMRSFEEALSLDPQYPPTYAWLAWTHMWNVWFGPSATRGQSLEKAFQFAEKAKALDDKSFGGPNALGHAYLLKRDYDKALSEGKLATELAPNSAAAATNFGWTLRSVGRYEEAMKEYERALRLDPLNTDHTLAQIGTTYLMMRRYEESISASKKALQGNPRFLAAHITLAMAYSSSGKMEEAREASSEVLKLSPNFSVEHFSKALPYKNEADREFMADALRKAGLK